MPNDNENDPIFREIDLAAEIRRMWGPEWNRDEIAYEFSNGRQFRLRTEDSGIYGRHSSGDPLILEDGGLILQENEDHLLQE